MYEHFAGKFEVALPNRLSNENDSTQNYDEPSKVRLCKAKHLYVNKSNVRPHIRIIDFVTLIFRKMDTRQLEDAKTHKPDHRNPGAKTKIDTRYNAYTSNPAGLATTRRRRSPSKGTRHPPSEGAHPLKPKSPHPWKRRPD